jgi:hypothetical protein
MTHIQRLREYRSRMVNELNTKVDTFLADGHPAEQVIPLHNYINKVQTRVRLLNTEIDHLEAAH